MSKRANPVHIGLFVTGAGVLLVGLLVFLGAGLLFEQRERFVLFFDESVNGLTVGSPVKFKGVPIGRVVRILIRMENQPADSSAIPVIIELDDTRLRGDLGVGLEIRDDHAFAEQVAQGLRGRLNVESMITGMLFVELDYHDEVDPPRIVQETYVYKEIPTIPSATQQLLQQARETFARMGQIDIAALAAEARLLLQTATLRLDEMDTARLVDSMVEVADSVSELARSVDLPVLVESAGEVMESMQRVMAKLEGDLDHMTSGVGEVMEEFHQVLGNADLLLSNLNELTHPESRRLHDLEQMMIRVSRAADAIRQVVEFIERNPRAFLTGRHTDP